MQSSISLQRDARPYHYLAAKMPGQEMLSSADEEVATDDNDDAASACINRESFHLEGSSALPGRLLAVGPVTAKKETPKKASINVWAGDTDSNSNNSRNDSGNIGTLLSGKSPERSQKAGSKDISEKGREEKAGWTVIGQSVTDRGNGRKIFESRLVQRQAEKNVEEEENVSAGQEQIAGCVWGGQLEGPLLELAVQIPQDQSATPSQPASLTQPISAGMTTKTSNSVSPDFKSARQLQTLAWVAAMQRGNGPSRPVKGQTTAMGGVCKKKGALAHNQTLVPISHFSPSAPSSSASDDDDNEEHGDRDDVSAASRVSFDPSWPTALMARQNPATASNNHLPPAEPTGPLHHLRMAILGEFAARCREEGHCVGQSEKAGRADKAIIGIGSGIGIGIGIGIGVGAAATAWCPRCTPADSFTMRPQHGHLFLERVLLPLARVVSYADMALHVNTAVAERLFVETGMAATVASVAIATTATALTATDNRPPNRFHRQQQQQLPLGYTPDQVDLKALPIYEDYQTALVLMEHRRRVFAELPLELDECGLVRRKEK